MMYLEDLDEDRRSHHDMFLHHSWLVKKEPSSFPIKRAISLDSTLAEYTGNGKSFEKSKKTLWSCQLLGRWHWFLFSYVRPVDTRFCFCFWLQCFTHTHASPRIFSQSNALGHISSPDPGITGQRYAGRALFERLESNVAKLGATLHNHIVTLQASIDNMGPRGQMSHN